MPGGSRVAATPFAWELLLLATGAGLLHGAYLWFEVPLLQNLPGWFWTFGRIELHHGWIVALVGLAFAAMWKTAGSRRLPVSGWLALSVVLGFGTQIGVSLVEGRGREALVDPIVRSGHGEFSRVAVREPSLTAVAREYETRLATDGDAWGGYGASKPPGYLLFYMLTARLAGWGEAPTSPEARLARFAVFASIVWAWVSCLSVLALYVFARCFVAPPEAKTACLLWLSLPAFQLVTGQLDQVLLPSLLLGSLALAGHGARRGNLLVVGCAGACCVLATFVSFSLLPVWPLALAVVVACGRRGGVTGARGWARVGLGFVGGAALLQGVLALAFDYDVLERFAGAMTVHAGWKQYEMSARYVLYAGIVDVLELAFWWGAALLVLWGASFSDAFARVLTGRVEHTDALAFASLAVLLALLVFGRTLSEVARLWLFLAPLACVGAADQIRRRFPTRAEAVALGLLVLQLGTLWLLKLSYDLHPEAS